MNIVIPMAGRGTRLADWQKNTPKPFISVAGKPMILWAIESLQGITASRLILVALSEHERLFGLKNLIRPLITSTHEFVFLENVTEGQLCTVLAARKWIDTDEDLLIASSDTYVRSNISNDIKNQPTDCKGLISVADLPDSHWSFARTDKNGRVLEVAEKVRISNNASTGLYYFRKGSDFVFFADEIIRKGEKTRNEYFVIPVYQKFIDLGMKINISQAYETWDMGNPDAIIAFEQHYAKKNPASSFFDLDR